MFCSDVVHHECSGCRTMLSREGSLDSWLFKNPKLSSWSWSSSLPFHFIIEGCFWKLKSILEWRLCLGRFRPSCSPRELCERLCLQVYNYYQHHHQLFCPPLPPHPDPDPRRQHLCHPHRPQDHHYDRNRQMYQIPRKKQSSEDTMYCFRFGLDHEIEILKDLFCVCVLNPTKGTAKLLSSLAS